MILEGFIQGTSDEELLKSLPTENISEDLVKAMNKVGLVQKEVQVKGKNGQTFTRKQWVRASDAQPTAQPKQAAGSIEISEKNFPKGSTLYYNGEKATVQRVGKEFSGGGMGIVVRFANGGTGVIGKSDMKKVSKTPAENKQPEQTTTSKNNAVKSSKNEVKVGDTLKINGNSVEVLKVNDKDYTVKNADGIVSHVSKKAVEDGVATHTKQAANSQNHFTGKSKDELWSNLKSAGYEVDSADKHTPQDKITLYKDKQEFTATFNKYSDGGVEVSNIKPAQTSTAADKKPSQSYTSTGDLQYNGQTISKIFKHGAYMYKVRGVKDLFGSQKQAKEYVDRHMSDQNTATQDKSKASMLEDYFAGNHGQSDSKSALTALLGKGYSRQDIMSQAEKSGITWKKNDHEGINWMRASMAIQKAWKKG